MSYAIKLFYVSQTEHGITYLRLMNCGRLQVVCTCGYKTNWRTAFTAERAFNLHIGNHYAANYRNN